MQRMEKGKLTKATSEWWKKDTTVKSDGYQLDPVPKQMGQNHQQWENLVSKTAMSLITSPTKLYVEEAQAVHEMKL
jgi:hypothetical protein